MLAILISIRSRHIANIFNGKKLRELRKKFPKHYRGWVYIYCCKDKLSLAEYLYKDGWVYDAVLNYDYAKSIGCAKEKLNGKVCARFWCDNVDEYYRGFNLEPNPKTGYHDSIANSRLIEESCLTYDEICKYSESNKLSFFAIHISKLELFDKPMDLSKFLRRGFEQEKHDILYAVDRKTRREFKDEIEEKINCVMEGYRLRRPPQSWQYVEVTL